MKSYKSESNVSPSEWMINVDTVYHNYNISSEERTNELSEEKQIMYTYDVDEYTLQEYTTTQIQNNTQTIDNIIISMLGE